MPSNPQKDEELLKKLSEIMDDIDQLRSLNGTFNKKILKEVESAAIKVKNTLHNQSPK